MTDSIVTAGRADAPASPLPRRLFRTSIVLAVMPVVSATVRALHSGWLPIGDNAYFDLRSRDVFSHHLPLLGAWTSASQTTNSNFNNPGPLFFDALSVPVTLFHSSGIAVAIALLNSAAIVGIALVAHRRGGPLVATAAMAMAGGLTWTMGSELLFDPWQPHAMLVPFLLFMVLVWALACGDLVMLPWAIGVASFVVETHLSYAVIVPGLMVWGVGALAWSVWRLRGDDPDGWSDLRRRVRRISFISLGVFLVCWSLPLIEEVQHRGHGNLSLLLTNASHSKQTIGFGLGTRVVASIVSLPPWWLRPSFADALTTTPSADSAAGLPVGPDHVPSKAAALMSLVLVVLLLGVLLWTSRRRGDRTVVAVIGTAGVAMLGALLTAGTLPRGVLGVAPHQFRYLWPISVFVTFALVLAVARRLDRPDPAKITAVFFAAGLVLSGLNLPELNQAAGPSASADSIPTVRTLVSQLGSLEGHGPLLFDMTGLRFAEPYSFSVIDDLDSRGVEIVFSDEGMVRQLGEARRFTGSANGRLFLREGDAAATDQPGATRVAIAYGLNADELRERDDLRSQISVFLASGQLRLGSGSGREPPLPSDLQQLLPGDQIGVLLSVDEFALDSTWLPRFERYAELQRRWDIHTVAVFIAPLPV